MTGSQDVTIPPSSVTLSLSSLYGRTAHASCNSHPTVRFPPSGVTLSTTGAVLFASLRPQVKSVRKNEDLAASTTEHSCSCTVRTWPPEEEEGRGGEEEVGGERCALGALWSMRRLPGRNRVQTGTNTLLAGSSRREGEEVAGREEEGQLVDRVV